MRHRLTPTLLEQARWMVQARGGLTQPMTERLLAAGYEPSYVAALVKLWKGTTA